MTNLEDILLLDGTAQADLVRRREVHPIELVEAAITRIERLNPVVNAVVTPMYEHARQMASKPLPDGPFAGVPFLLKDLIAEYAGARMTEGSNFLGDFASDEDSDLVRRLKRAGLIVIGKTNAPEFGIGVTTEPQRFGATHNPWDISRTPGGSSGGSAAAVAARLVSMAHGNDAGGSLRIPASCCGVFALKPTRGRNPLGPHYGELFGGLVSEHALTLSVRDSAALLDATSGPTTGDPYWAPPPAGPYIQEVGMDPGRLRIAFSLNAPLGTELNPDCVEATTKAAHLCAEMGHEVVETAPSLDWESLWRSFTTVLAAGLAWSVEEWGRRLNRRPASEHFEPFVWAFYKRGRSVKATEYIQHTQRLHWLSRRIAEFFADQDLWLTPTLGSPPVPLGTFSFDNSDPFELRRRMAIFSPFTYISNVTGQPSMSVPLFWNPEGLPVGVHFVGRFGAEATLFRLAAQLEAAHPWSSRRPSLNPNVA